MKLKHLHYGWVMVIIATCVLVAYATAVYTFGIFLIPLTTEFNWDRGALSGAYSLKFLLGGLLSILTGRISDKYGPRPLIITAGLTTGMGFLLMSQVTSLWQVYISWGLLFGVTASCCWVPLMSTIPRWFAKKRGMAIGITAAGFGLGSMIWPPLAQWLISSYGWRQAFKILGLIAFIIMFPLAQFMKHSPQRIGLRPYGEDGGVEDKQSLASTAGGFSFTQAIKTGRFWFFGSIMFCFFFCLQVIMVHIAPYAVDIGISAIVAASMLSIIAAASVIGRFSAGFICDKVGLRRPLVACLVTATLALIWLLFAKEIWMFYVFAVIFGVAYGGIISLQSLVTAELFGLSSLGIVFGSLMFFGTIGGAIGPPLAGTIFDVTGGYNLAFLICVIIGALAIIFSLILLKARAGVAVTK